MDIREALVAEHSKHQVMRIVRYNDGDAARSKDAEQAVAIRVFAMTLAERIAPNEPELSNEVRLVAEKHAPHTTKAFRVMAGWVLASP